MPNPSTNVLLISEDLSLIESCQGIADSIPSLRLMVIDRAGEAASHLVEDEIKLVLVHLVEESDTRKVVALLRRLASLKRAVTMVVISEQDDAEQAWSLTRLGAADYLSRPLDLNRLTSLINAFSLQTQDGDLESALAEPVDVGGSQFLSLAASCRGMNGLQEQVRLVASQATTILLAGETGTGKTCLARMIHEHSPRRGKPFVVINCAALPAELIESEMFGHVKGAFTGADRARVGRFAAAGQGTLLLDDIDALPLALQPKLLRAVDELVFEPVGSDEAVPVQARLIAACNRPLEREVEAGRFRADLYYRLNVISFQMPPLRERPTMIRYLITNFLQDWAARNGRPVRGIAIEALRVLESYRWPGNIRELRNVIERALALCPGPYIRVADLPEAICSVASSPFHSARQTGKFNGHTSRSVLHNVKRETEAALILETLRKHGNNRRRAASELGISRRTLYKKLHEYGLMYTT
jgi:DNA-binding NtrC family response regulator